MFDTITSGDIFLTLIVIGAILFIFLLYVAFRLESLSKQYEKQRDMSELKTQIVAEIKKDTGK
jgi:hypothetical protein